MISDRPKPPDDHRRSSLVRGLARPAPRVRCRLAGAVVAVMFAPLLPGHSGGESPQPGPPARSSVILDSSTKAIGAAVSGEKWMD